MGMGVDETGPESILNVGFGIIDIRTLEFYQIKGQKGITPVTLSQLQNICITEKTFQSSSSNIFLTHLSVSFLSLFRKLS
jgi:hypothetical protein